MDINQVIREYMLVGGFRPRFFQELNAAQKCKRGTLAESEIIYIADAISGNMKYHVNDDYKFSRLLKSRQGGDSR